MLSLVLAAGLATAGADCSCATTFAATVHAVEANYPGYAVKLPDAASQDAYRRFRGLLAEDAAFARDPAQCRAVLDAYLAFFGDDHLFVTNVTAPADAPSDSTIATAAPELPELAARWTPEKVEFRLRREGGLDPVEGLWRDSEGQFAIVHDDAIPRGEYVAFRFSYRYGTRPGEIIAFVRPNGDGSYSIQYKSGSGVWQRARGTLNNATGVLSFAGLGWQRTTQPSTPLADGNNGADTAAPARAATVADADPLAPRFRSLGSGVYYLSLPSFMPRYRESLDTLIQTHEAALAEANGLIVDLRGNGGGVAIYEPLARLLLTGPVVVGEDSAVLASPWNIEAVEQLRQQLGGNGAYLDPVLARMRANPGRMVPYLDERVAGPAAVENGPERVVVLQDRSVGDAAEAFLLQMKQSGKVVTMGESSKGSIDYQQVQQRTVGCGPYAVAFHWPLILRSRALPEGSLDDSGIAPHVRLSPVHGDWTDYAERWLRAGR